MVRTMIFDDGELAREVEGEAVFQVVITKEDREAVHAVSSVVGVFENGVFLDCLASACAAQIVDLTKNSDNSEIACMAIAYFMSKLRKYGANMIKEKYPDSKPDLKEE